MEYLSSCGTGLEELVSNEIRDWKGDIAGSERGAVRWSGSLEAGYRSCLWSRFCSRVVLILAEFTITDSDDLYEAVRSISWEEHLSEQSSFAVDCVLSGKGPVTNSMFGALRVKDGLVDRFRQRTSQRPDVQVQRPDVRIYVQIGATRVRLGIDLSGESLHRRGYRVEAGPAPLKENLGAAIIAFSGWDGSTLLWDPMCGSGTLLIEAALMHSHSAPGLGRSYFGLYGWFGHQGHIWESLINEAIELEDAAREKEWPQLIGYDGDRSAVRAARKNIAKAGLENRITIRHQEIQRLDNSFHEPGHLVCNPPYGERLSDKQSVKYLYRFIGTRLQQSFSDWQISLFTAAPDYADQFKLGYRSNIKIFNGPLACRLLNGSPLPLPPDNSEDLWQISDNTGQENDQELRNRLIKNFKRLQPWASEHGFDDFRLYDRDLPQFNVTIDIIGYQIYINEFPPSSSKDPQIVDERFSQVTRVVRCLFDIGRNRVVINRWDNRKGKGKKGDSRQRLYEVREGGAVFMVAPETGFSVDQRLVRRHIHDTIGRGSFLSLFDSGGAAAVCAALGGAHKTISLGLPDKDKVSLKINFSRNGMTLSHHRLIDENPLIWLKKNPEPFALIYINLRQKTYYLGKSLRFDALSDHRKLIDLAMRNLTKDGSLILSTLLPSFALDSFLRKRFTCTELSRKMASADVKNAGQNFGCWQILKIDAGESARSI